MFKALIKIIQTCNDDPKKNFENKSKIWKSELTVQYKCNSEPISYTYMPQNLL